ncbi:hypothetical protein [Flagellimonas pelagia]|uniref:T9SS C-terminal target domain-containing protein n=1 Tax=Flagellimonas pelagia TaxID=2306998 RepID=A0A3A1NJB7_9FLAO|nr:hypothetical protein [Allomuricauda maritima]RIV44120.1 hypothetical protein D2V05_11555 [Allomuricauda maritima]TXJ94029.1 hypothetical protein FQ017_11445 [Allomuricauda maritima]
MKKLIFPLLAIAAFAISSCSSDNNDPIIPPGTEPTGEEITKSGELTADEEWTADNIYILDGKVVVGDGVTLTINPGTIIKGAEGLESLASALVVDQGGTLIAEGTPSKPIIFTSVLDGIEQGETTGTLTIADTGLWGGVILLGKAPISVNGDVETAQIEGIPADESYGQYGGTEPGDSSGSLKYVSIRHGGITIGQDNEINGLTLGGVGSGTTIDHVEIVANQDDGIEFFGGTVNVSNALIWSQGDDGFDLDQAYNGTLDNGVVILGSESDSALEMDGPEGSAATEAGFTLQNITLIGANTSSKYADLRDGLIANLDNIFAYGFGVDGAVKINGADSATELSNDRITFSNWQIVLPEGVLLSDVFTGDYNAGDESKFLDNATAVGTGTTGADMDVFNWTLAAAEGAIPTAPLGTTITKSGILTTDEHWTSDNIYVLDGKVVIGDGITLTIDPGTIVKGAEGLESLASALVVDQGGVLLAEGTPTQPIIFTSVLDGIEQGQTTGTLSISDTGLWGGVIVLGKAPISVNGDVETAQIEGIPADETYGQYGGTDPADYSGIIKYVSIRHGGITIGQDNEINGLTLGGVGSETIIDHVEIVANQDDGIEFFGGTVNVSNALVWSQGDDGFDLDQAYSGTLDNGVVILGSESDSALEMDGPEGSAATEAGFTLQNITLIGANTSSKYADLRDGLIANLDNIFAYGFGVDGAVKINGADSATELSNDRITFSGWEIILPNGVALADIFTGDFTAGDEAKFLNNATAILTAGEATVGADLTEFSWTLAASESAF